MKLSVLYLLPKFIRCMTSAIGKHTLSTANNRGELLAQFYVNNNLLVTNTMFQKKKLFTWTSPDGKTRNQIDFILSRKPSLRLNILDSSALNAPDISDHRRMKRTKIRLNFSWPQRKRSIPKPDLEQLKQPEVAARFQLILQNRFTGLESETDSENIYNTICNGVNDASKETLAGNTEPIPQWMSQQTKLAIANKHKIRKEKGSLSMQYKKA